MNNSWKTQQVITTNNHRIQANDAIVCCYSFIAFIYFKPKGKKLLDYNNLFSFNK